MKAPTPFVALCAIWALAGCGGGSSSADSSSAKPKPQVTAPTAPPPKRLVIKDLEEGAGPAVKAGDQVTVRWAGFLYRGAREFFSSWHDHDTFTFKTNAGRVIPGWDRGMKGMKAGGRRELIIPPSLAYGYTGTTSVPANETLIYVIDLLSVEKAASLH